MQLVQEQKDADLLGPGIARQAQRIQVRYSISSNTRAAPRHAPAGVAKRAVNGLRDPFLCVAQPLTVLRGPPDRISVTKVKHESGCC